MADDHADKRRAILDGAAEVFERRGFTGGTTREIASTVGLSQPAIYHYVGSKEALLSEIALQVDHDLTAALECALAVSADPVAQLRALVRELCNAVIVNRRTFAVYWKELHALPDDVRSQIAGDERLFVKQVEELVVAAQGQGALPPHASPRILTEAILGMTSWTYRWYRPDSGISPDEVAGAYLQLLGLV